MLKLIPIPPEERHKYRCHLCGETRSVKYFIPTHDPLVGEGFSDLPYCNKCALFLIGEEETAKCLKSENTENT